MKADTRPALTEPCELPPLQCAPSPILSSSPSKRQARVAPVHLNRAITMTTDHTDAAQSPKSAKTPNPYVSFFSQYTQDHFFPSETQTSRRKDDLQTLQELGVRSSAALPSELNIFGNRRASKLHMSTMDLRGPAHARVALRAMGLTAAFKELEGKEIRERIKLENISTARFNPRMADAITEMRVLNQPMVRSSSSVPFKSNLLVPERKPPADNRLRALHSIMESCDQLAFDNFSMRKSLKQPLFSQGQKTIRRKRGTF